MILSITPSMYIPAAHQDEFMLKYTELLAERDEAKVSYSSTSLLLLPFALHVQRVRTNITVQETHMYLTKSMVNLQSNLKVRFHISTRFHSFSKQL